MADLDRSLILVAGSAHLDMLAQARERDDVIDKIGEVGIEVGGTACNVAINLARSGVRVRLLTAMNRSCYSKITTEYLMEHGVEPCVDYDDSLPTAAFSAHLSTVGEMVGAVSSMPVESITFEPSRIAQVMEGVVAVFLDCNLSPMALNRLVTFANDRNLPVYLSAVSEQKSLRIGGVSGRLQGVFINQREFRFFCRSVLGSVMAPGDAARALQCMLLVTEGAAGSTLALPDGSASHIPAPEIDGKGSCLGMGDALAAGVVLMHEVHGLPFEEATLRALDLAAQVGSSRHCHLGAFGAVESAIGRFQHNAGHDAMTGALNRHSAELALSKALERKRKGDSDVLCVLMLDIDHFKSINDTFGHNAGDDVIRAVTKAAQGCLRTSDSLGRWGGEEFVVILPDTPREAALQVAERVRSAVEANIQSPRPVTISIGCSEAVAGQSDDVRSLMEAADRALYEAKHGGRNRVVCASVVPA